MSLTAAEQYGIELLNRARLNPMAESAKYNVGLNQGIRDIDTETRGVQKLSSTQKQALAPNQAIDTASTKHAAWMISTDKFSHTGYGGSDAGQRMSKAGYKGVWGENIAYQPYGRSVEETINMQHASLMKSAYHRANLLTGYFQEVGYSQVIGGFRGSSGSMLTQNFGVQIEPKHAFITGVAYNDRNGNNFYNIGEGQGGIRFDNADGPDAVTASAGGYAVKVSQQSTVTINLGDNREFGSVTIRVSFTNVKLDLVNKDTLFIAGNATLNGGIDDIRLLGINGNSLVGDVANNHIWGNAGNNELNGKAGADSLYGGKGNDTLLGGEGDDVLIGSDGRDKLNGGLGDDVLTGGAGADRFEFTGNMGADVIADFSKADGDVIALDDALWSDPNVVTAQGVIDMYATETTAGVVLNFQNGKTITLTGVTTLDGLAAYIEII